MVWKSPIPSCDLVFLMQAGFVNKPCGRYAAVNPVFVSLVTGLARTNPYWQQWHGHDSVLYYLLANLTFGLSAFAGKHLAVQPSRALLSVRMCIRCPLRLDFPSDVVCLLLGAMMLTPDPIKKNIDLKRNVFTASFWHLCSSWLLKLLLGHHAWELKLVLSCVFHTSWYTIQIRAS